MSRTLARYIASYFLFFIFYIQHTISIPTLIWSPYFTYSIHPYPYYLPSPVQPFTVYPKPDSPFPNLWSENFSIPISYSLPTLFFISYNPLPTHVLCYSTQMQITEPTPLASLVPSPVLSLPFFRPIKKAWCPYKHQALFNCSFRLLLSFVVQFYCF